MAWALAQSPTREVLVEESVLGWKEYELEVMRDRADNFIVVCSIENIDPMGVHTGDSITVAPAMTLTDSEYQRLRDAALRVMREIGVETGGSNVQFAVNPADGRMVIIEMNPRVSRSSALASKATGYPIAKIAAKLAVGYTLDELKNDITRETPASFEPTIDYVVVKWPRFAFEKFPGADATLGTQMKSVGEVDGDRPHVPRGAAEGGALARDRARPASTARSTLPADARSTSSKRRDARCPTAGAALPGRRRAAARRHASTRSHAHHRRSTRGSSRSMRAHRRRAKRRMRGRALTSIGAPDAARAQAPRLLATAASAR